MLVGKKQAKVEKPKVGLVETPELPKSAPKAKKTDVVEEKPGKANASDVAKPTRGKSALHARIGDTQVESEKPVKNPVENPEWFWNGKLKWKVAPPDVEVITNPDNKDGSNGWIEKWKAPGAKKWTHNYTLEELERKAGEKFAHVNV